MGTLMAPGGGLVPQNFNLKSFWARPEGKVGMGVLALAAAFGIYEWGTIVPFLVSMMEDTVHLALLVGGFVVAGWVLFSKRTHLIFRLAMRAMTGMVITIDPIGILKDRLQQMRVRRAKMEEQIGNVSGQLGTLKNIIESNHKNANKKMELAEYARLQAGKSTDDATKLKMSLQTNVQAAAAGRLEQANSNYQSLLTKLQNIYDLLTKWAVHVDAYIESTEDEVRQQEIQYKVINAASGAMRQAMSVLKGNATEEDMYNTTMEYLADQAGQKLGEMDNMSRIAQNFMDNADLQNGAVTADALKQLDAYEAKLALPGNTDTAFLLPGATTQQPVPARLIGQGAAASGRVASASSSDDYNNLFK